MGWKILIGIAVVLVCFIAWQWADYHRIRITRKTITYPKAHRWIEEVPKRICVLADLHERQFGAGNRRLLEAIGRCRPDIILIPGDLVVRHRRLTERAKALLCGLSNLGIPTFVSPGNHETGMERLHPETFAKFREVFSQSNITYLDNASVRLSEHVLVSGMRIPDRCYKLSGRKERLTDEDFARVGGLSADDGFVILLAHTPYYFPEYAKHRADLTVSGHVHGGIVRLPFLGGVISSQMELFPKYDAGIFREGDSVMALTTGLGAHTLPVRVFNPPEIMILTVETSER